MDFFQHQDRARTKTSLLVIYFTLAVAAIVGAVYGAVVLLVSMGSKSAQAAGSHQLFFASSALTLFVILAGTLYKVSTLRSGGRAVAEMLGARRVSPDTRDAAERRLRNVVEEMAIASGVAVPDVYVFDEEGSINAFAAGLSPDSAVIAVSRGALSELTREQLQGVVAHEFSHVFNGDMRLNLRLMGLLHGILAIALAGRIILRSTGRGRGRGKGAGGIVMFGAALMAIGYIGVLFSRLIKSAISRQREFLADASAVQYTRNPDGILGSLMKIRRNGSKVENARAEELSHLFFAQSFHGWLSSVFATHPPLEDRIEAIRPGASQQDIVDEDPSSITEKAPAPKAEATVQSGFSGETETSTVIQRVGNPSAQDLDGAVAFKASLPLDVSEMMMVSQGSRQVVSALLLSDDHAVRKRQLANLGSADHLEPVRARLEGLRPRLGLVELAVPALRDLPERERREFLDQVHALVREDNRVQPFELALELILTKSLLPQEKRPAIGSLRAATEDAIRLLSFLAYAGSGVSSAKADEAFRAGYSVLGLGKPKAVLPWDQCGHDSVIESVKCLAHAVPEVKRTILAACVACVLSDMQVQMDEWEIVRAFAEALECPVPLAMPTGEMAHLK